MSYETSDPKCSFDDLVLPELVMAQIKDIMEDHEYQDALLENGLAVRKKILIHGPPGCGKTSIAHAFAKALKLRFYMVQTSQIIDSHLGASERNMDLAIKFSQLNKVVMLFDEFDSVAGQRGDHSDGASTTVNRVVNTILTSLEAKPPLGLLIACTNLYDNIDKAVVRRFDTIISVPEASREALLTIARNIINGRFGIKPEEILREASTPSDVVRATNDMLRRRVIEDEKSHLANKAALEKAQAIEARAQLSMMIEDPGPGKRPQKRAPQTASM